MAHDIRPSGNIVGTQVRRLRCERELSQLALAEICQRLGWDIGRDIIARIESGTRLVTDSELVILSQALDVPLLSLFPSGVIKPREK